MRIITILTFVSLRAISAGLRENSDSIDYAVLVILLILQRRRFYSVKRMKYLKIVFVNINRSLNPIKLSYKSSIDLLISFITLFSISKRHLNVDRPLKSLLLT
jgi:hypothetical protein